VWDLDNTVWDGVCLEGPVRVREGVTATIRELDRRGILHSIASRGDESVARGALREFGLEDLFLVPQINWLPKSQSLVRIAKDLALPLDAIAFVDDDRFEREQIAFMLPEVLVIDAEVSPGLPEWPDFSPAVVTTESRDRRTMYQAEIRRKGSERNFATREEFLRSCAMKLGIRPMTDGDIPRVLELMTRTHQLNTTGRILERTELDRILQDAGGPTRIFVAELEDRFGSYGCIGTAMLRLTEHAGRLTYLALSCRVMGRGIERVMLAWIAHTLRQEGIGWLDAEYRNTGRNRMMRALYQMEGFREVPDGDEPGFLLFRAPCAQVPEGPPWLEIL